MIVVIAIVTSVITSFLVGRFYLNLQYHKSNAGFRQQQIIDCTRALVHESGMKGTVPPELHIKYRYALSEVLEKLMACYGLKESDGKKLPPQHYPVFQKDASGDEVQFFQEKIRPVMIDLNNNAFIGWINWVPNVQRLTTLWTLCFTLEKICTGLEYLKAKNVVGEDQSIHPIGEWLVVLKDHQGDQKEIDELKKHHETIRQLWYKWVALNKISS